MAGNQYEVAELTRSALAEGVDPAAIFDTAYIPAMDLVGDQFSRGVIFVPEMLRSARAMKTGMEIIKPCYSSHAEHAKATVVICTVKVDLHDIGKNLVAMMLEGSRVKVIDMGVDAGCERVIGNVQEYHPDFLVMSALLTTTMISMEKTVLPEYILIVYAAPRARECSTFESIRSTIYLSGLQFTFRRI